jgi:hypothetical protein
MLPGREKVLEKSKLEAESIDELKEKPEKSNLELPVFDVGLNISKLNLSAFEGCCGRRSKGPKFPRSKNGPLGVICDTGDFTGTQSSLDTGDGVTLQRLWLCGRITFDLGRDVNSVWLTEYTESDALLEDTSMDSEYSGAT